MAYVSITSITELNCLKASVMDKISDNLDHDVSLDEVLAFIDAYDFGISTIDDHDQAVDPTECFDSIDIEDTLVAIPEDAAPQAHSNTRDEFAVKLQFHGISASSGIINAQDKRSCSAPSTPYKERGRVRERVIRLRGVVKQLEQQLEELTELSRQKAKLVEELSEDSENESNTMNSKTDAADNDSDVVTWQQLAIRQYTARREVEKENKNLRERLEEQLRVAMRLKRLVQGQLPDYYNVR